MMKDGELRTSKADKNVERDLKVPPTITHCLNCVKATTCVHLIDYSGMVNAYNAKHNEEMNGPKLEMNLTALAESCPEFLPHKEAQITDDGR